MEFADRVEINAPQRAVWDFLTDPDKVASCAPGVKSVEVLEPDKKFKVVGSVGLGTVKLNFVALVEWEELDPPNMARMKAHGDAPGSAMDAAAQMSLEPAGDSLTYLDWSAEVTVSGTVAALAARMMGSVKPGL